MNSINPSVYFPDMSSMNETPVGQEGIGSKTRDNVRRDDLLFIDTNSSI